MTPQKVEIFEVKLTGEESYNFFYPTGAKVVIEGEDSSQGVVNFADGCVVSFGNQEKRKADFSFSEEEMDNVEKKNAAEVVYEAWYREERLVMYVAYEEALNFGFWTVDEEADVGACSAWVDYLMDTFTDESFYVSDRFYFSVPLKEDYKVEFLPDDQGVVLRKWYEQNPEADAELRDVDYDEGLGGYKVEIIVVGRDNFEDFEDVIALVQQKYPGYSVEFSGAGVFIDEGGVGTAIRHYFFMSADKDIVYEAYLTVPSFYYSRHKEGFDEWVKTIEIF